VIFGSSGYHFSCCGFVSQNCSNVTFNTRPELKEGDIFNYKKISYTDFFGATYNSTTYKRNLTFPVTLNHTYVIKEIKNSQTDVCYTIISYTQNILSEGRYDGKNRYVNFTIENDTYNKTICINTSLCRDIFSGYLPQSFEAVVENVKNYKYQKKAYGKVIKNIDENITLNTTYKVIGEEDICNISCYKVKITNENICCEEKGCNICYTFYILWIDKKKRILVQLEKYVGSILVEKLILY